MKDARKDEEVSMSLEVILPVVVFIVVGCVSLYLGLQKVQFSQQQGNVRPWYKQTTIYQGITSFSLAVFFLLIGLYDSRPEGDANGRLLLAILAGIVLLCGVISCAFMIRYFPFVKSKE